MSAMVEGHTFPPERCAALGDETTAVCAAPDSSRVECNYTGGDGNRGVAVRYVCAKGDSATTAAACDPATGACFVEVRGRWACGATRKRDRWGLATLADSYGLLRDEFSNTTSVAEMVLLLESLAPGAVAAIAVSASLVACCFCVMLCYVRSRMRRMRAEFDERLRLVSAQREVDAFDDERGGGQYSHSQFGPDEAGPGREVASSTGRGANGRRRKGRTARFDDEEDDGL